MFTKHPVYIILAILFNLRSTTAANIPSKIHRISKIQSVRTVTIAAIYISKVREQQVI